MVTLIAQIIGIVGMIVSVLSFQCKSNKNYFICQGCSGGLFSVNFFLLGAVSGAGQNVVNIFRGFLFAFVPDKKRWMVCVGTIIGFVVATVLTFPESGIKSVPGIFAILLFLAQTAGSITMLINDGKIIRIVQLFFVSPIWLSHNFYYKSIGGTICEAFAIISVIVSFIRYRSGFEK